MLVINQLVLTNTFVYILTSDKSNNDAIIRFPNKHVIFYFN